MAKISFEEAKKLIRLDTYREIAEEYEKIIDEGIEQKWGKTVLSYSKTDIDPVDAESDEVEMLRLFRYRMQLMIICCLCETWEQDLYNFLKEEKLIIVKSKDDESNCYTKTKSIFNEHFKSKIEKYPKINEMRVFVNSIKHGAGRSFKCLIKELGDSVLADSNVGWIKEDGSKKMIKQHESDSNALTSVTLIPDGKIEEYYDEIVRFWKTVFSEMENKEDDN